MTGPSTIAKLEKVAEALTTLEGAIRGDAVEPVPDCVYSVRAGIRSVIADFFGDDISTHMLTSAGLATVKMKFERKGAHVRCRLCSACGMYICCTSCGMFTSSFCIRKKIFTT